LQGKQFLVIYTYMNDAPIKIVISKLGGQAKLAELLGTKQSTVSYWFRCRNAIPAEKAVELERVTDGEIPRWMSRPDLWEPPASEDAA
jgi:DNA-binding transcriptional regulator YdaS (Cro superfamily)